MISTHILDLNLGKPASSLVVILEKKNGIQWDLLEQLSSNSDGRISFQTAAQSGVFRLTFQIDDYLKKLNVVPFFLTAPMTFEITDTGRKYHIPFLLNHYGYSTYRGT